jgi:hypothetical protein
MSKGEDWYDKEVAPKLKELADACRARGMSFIACVEWEPGSRGITYSLTDDAGLEMIMVKHCATTAPNIDGYVIGLIGYCHQKGIDTSASFVMQQLGKTADTPP